MSGRLPEQIDPRRLARQASRLQGRLPLARLPRLGHYLSGSNGAVEVQLTFGIDPLGVRYVRGHLSTVVTMTCQRCMEPMEQALEVELSLGVVGGEAEGEQLPGEYDPLIVGDSPVRVADIVEEELILALPVVARHERDACAAPNVPAADDSADEESSDSPFAVLEELKRKH